MKKRFILGIVLCTLYANLFAYDEYFVTNVPAPNSGGTVTVLDNGDGTFSLQADPADGWVFTKWSDASTNNPITVEPDGDTWNFYAVFTDRRLSAYSKSKTTDPANGGTVTASQGSCDGQWTLTAVPDTANGWIFLGWDDNGDGVVDAGNASPRNVTINLSKDTFTYKAIFEEHACNLYTPKYTDPASGGTVRATAGSCECDWQIEATPTDGWTFKEWNDGNTTNPRDITITDKNASTIKYTATFVPTCSVNRPRIANVTGLGSSSVTQPNASCVCRWQLSVTAAKGYVFCGWEDDEDAPATRTVDSDYDDIDTYTPIFHTCNYEFDEVVGTGGSVAAALINACECEWLIVATPADGWEFTKWSDGITTNPRTVTLDTDEGDYRAIFTDRRLSAYTKSQKTDPTNGGVLMVSKGTCDGTWIMSVIPDEANGWRFLGWDDDGDNEVDDADYSDDNPRNVTVNIEHDEFTYKAIFEQHVCTLYEPKYTTPAEGGTVTATQPDAYCDCKWQLTATPSAGYAFLKWMDGSIANPREIMIDSSKGDSTFTAKFIQTDVEVDGWTATDVVVRTKATDIGSSTATIYADGEQLASEQTLTRKDAGYWSIPAELNSHAGEKLKITFICSGDSIATVDGIVPYVVTSPTNVSSLTLPTNTDVHVLDTLTFNADATTIAALNIYPGAKAVVPSGKTLNVSSIYMRANGLTGKYPQLVANGSIHNANSDTIYYDYAINSSAYYPLSVPYDVPCNKIRTHTGKQASYEVSWYSGDDRAHNASGWNVFDDTADGATLRPDTGFIIYAVPYKWGRDSWRERQSRVTVRFPMEVNLESGEPEKTTTQIHLYGDKSWTNYSNLNWNFIGSPYLANYKHDSTDTKLDVGIFNPTDVEQQYSYTDNGVRYITNSTDGFRTYNQVRISQAVLVPFNPYFVQAKTAGTLSFPLSQRAQNAPQRFADANVPQEVAFGIVLSSTDCADRTGLLYGESFTGGYDMGDDLVKMHGSEPAFALYTLAGTDERVFNALALSAISQPVPVGFKNAPTGEMVFSFDDAHYDDAALDAVMLTDYEANRVVNLLEQDYLFTNTRAEDNTRFVIYAVLAPQTVTEIIAPAYDGTTLNGPDGIYDMLGRRVSAGDLPQGVYIVIENGQPRKEVIQ